MVGLVGGIVLNSRRWEDRWVALWMGVVGFEGSLFVRWLRVIFVYVSVFYRSL